MASILTYVGVQSWKATHLPNLEIRVEQGGIVLVAFDLYEASVGPPASLRRLALFVHPKAISQPLRAFISLQ